MNNKEKNFVSVIIYVHNAEKKIEQFLCAVIDIFEANFEHSEIICVDDASTDNSESEIACISKNAISTSISIIHMSYFHGLELAMSAGRDLSIGDFVFEFDSTLLDFDPSIVMKVYLKALEGYDIVSASPNKKEKLSSKVFYRCFMKYAVGGGRKTLNIKCPLKDFASLVGGSLIG